MRGSSLSSLFCMLELAACTRGGQMLMNESDDRRSFTDRTAHALHRARAHVADGEHAANARLERSGRVFCGGIGCRLAGEHEAMRVEHDATTFEPRRFGVRTDEDEYVTYRPLFLGIGAFVAPRNRSETVRQVAVKLRELRTRMDLDVRRSVDAIDQIARHARRKAGAPQ